MGYILKSGSSGLISVRLTDAGRRKLSSGQLSINLFQLGDSEFCYDCYTDVLNDSDGVFVIQPKWNSQNDSNQSSELNKMNVKYPIPISNSSSGQTYGVVTPAPNEQTVFNTARPRGFFSGTTSFSAYTSTAYTLSSNWTFPVSNATGGTSMIIVSGGCNTTDYTPKVGDLIMVQYSNQVNCSTDYLPVPTNAPFAHLFYKVTGAPTDLTGGTIVSSANTESTIILPVDRDLADFSMYSMTGEFNTLVYPGGDMLSYYGADTPTPYWSPGSLSFDNNCDVSTKDVGVWNMNINWTQQYDDSFNWGTVAGINSNTYEDVNGYGSSGYCGTKEYLGYNSNNGQADTTTGFDYYGNNNVEGYRRQESGTFIRDSFGRLRPIIPDDQRTVAILHYTNQTISNFYGEKFALLPENEGAINGIGEADRFKIHLPTLMWHKKKGGNDGNGTGTGQGDECTIGQTFYVDPPGFNNLAQVNYITSSLNSDMNELGIRYYHLWDDNLAVSSGDTSIPNRVGKVFPDLQMIIIDDQELVAAMSYKSNRNWTLPMPKLELLPMNTGQCATPPSCNSGFFNSSPNFEQVWVSYLLESTSGLTTGLHCNYYNSIIGDTTTGAKDVSLQFGSEFPYLRTFEESLCTPYSGTGFQADKFSILYQKTTFGTPPDPSLWNKVEFTDSIVGHTSGGAIQATGLTNSVFYLTCDTLLSGTTYNLHDYINVPLNNNQEPASLQFGDEYFFYGNIETDIMATIYEMRYSLSIAANQFTSSVNPTYSSSDIVRITEIGLFDNDKDLMAIAKLKNPTKRVGIQNFQIKIDF